MPQIPEIKKLAKTVSTADVINQIRAGASEDYKAAIPVVNPNDLDTLNRVGAALYQFTPHRNYFISELWNRLAIFIGKSKVYENPLKMFKIGLLQFGETIGEYFVDLVKAHNYDMLTAEKEFMKIEPANVKTAYHQMNFQKFYKTTITRQNIKMAFLSWEGLDDLVEKMIQALYTTCNWHEYLITKHMVGQAILNGAMLAVETPPLTFENAKQVTAVIRQASNDMTFLSRERNIAHVANFTDKSRQVLVINTRNEAIIDVEVLAASYNLPYSQFLAGQVFAMNAFNMEEELELKELFTGDNFNPNFKTFTEQEIVDLNTVGGCIVSRDWFIIADELFEMHESPFNQDGLYYNTSLHKWSTFSVSPFEEAQVFVGGTPTVTGITIQPGSLGTVPGSIVYLSATVTTTNFAPKGIRWTLTGGNGSSFIDYDGSVHIGLAEEAGQLTATATSIFDSSKSATCTITVGTRAN